MTIYKSDKIEFQWIVHVIAKPVKPLPKCTHCNGTGQISGFGAWPEDDLICKLCRGSGYIRWYEPQCPYLVVNMLQETLNHSISQNPDIMLNTYYPQPGSMYHI